MRDGSPIYLLSPANTAGPRARMLMRPAAAFELAVQLRTPAGASIADVFSFLSGLYFRGKVAYARSLGASGESAAPCAYVIASDRGLVPLESAVTIDDLAAMARVPIDADEPRYRKPLSRDVAALAAAFPKRDFVLLGSIATRKYVDVLLPPLGTRLKFPSEFVGRGDMSRGGLMLRCAETQQRLDYVPVQGAVRHGTRPPRLTARTMSGSV